MPALVLMPPVIRDMFDALGLRMAGLLMVPVVCFIGVIVPVLEPLVVLVDRGIRRHRSVTAGQIADESDR